jgi:spore coat protein U-like protein
VAYEEYRSSGCSSLWHAGDPIGATINFGSALSVSTSDSFWACIPSSQVYAAGAYTDTVTLTLSYNDGTDSTTTTTTHEVLIDAPPSCAFTTAPGAVNFNYTALQASVATANTTFGITCTIQTGVSMGVNPGGGVVSGLNYQLRLNAASSGGSNPLGTTGVGVQQLFYINATMPAGQAGECPAANCVDNRNHTLTLTF